MRQRRLDRAFQPGPEGCEDLLRKARGNRGEICAFLTGPDGKYREKLVRTLWDKDLRDVTRELLEDHLANLPPWKGGVPETVYWRWVACPRIALEKLTPWRGALKGWLKDWSGAPSQLRLYVRELLEEPEGAVFDRLYWPPEAALEGAPGTPELWDSPRPLEHSALQTALCRRGAIPTPFPGRLTPGLDSGESRAAREPAQAPRPFPAGHW